MFAWWRYLWPLAVTAAKMKTCQMKYQSSQVSSQVCSGQSSLQLRMSSPEYPGSSDIDRRRMSAVAPVASPFLAERRIGVMFDCRLDFLA
jgi:hypothetical protein